MAFQLRKTNSNLTSFFYKVCSGTYHGWKGFEVNRAGFVHFWKSAKYKEQFNFYSDEAEISQKFLLLGGGQYSTLLFDSIISNIL